jgi:predicted ribosomally synthesized peptide with SipW-like signal peptide
MTTLDEHNGDGDYVLVHKSKAKISKARKFIVGTMLVGAIAAIAGAGTFASFSASTTNEASFSTARMSLTNNGNCTTPAGVAGTGVASPDIDTNNVACDELFPDPLKPGEGATKNVTIENDGDVAGDLYLFATSACTTTVNLATYDMGTATDLCDRVVLSVEDTDTDTCLYPAGSVGAGCDDLDQNTPASQSFTDFSTNQQFDQKLTVAEGLAPNTTANVAVRVYWLKTVGTTDCESSLSLPGTATDDNTTGTDGVPDGFVDATGQGCDNPYMNQKANLNFRWQIQG